MIDRQQEINKIIQTHLIEWTRFADDVDELHKTSGIDIEECIKIVVKNYPQFQTN